MKINQGSSLFLDHVPPHVMATQIRVDYGEDNLGTVKSIFGEMTDSAIQVIEEKCPPELKTILAMALNLPIDTSGYPAAPFSHAPGSSSIFLNPFITDKTLELICKRLPTAEREKIRSIFEDAPPEITLLAIIIAWFRE